MNYQTQILKTSDEEDEILILSPLMKTYLKNLPHLIEMNNLQTHNLIEDDLDKEIEIKRDSDDYSHLSNDEFYEIEDDLRDEIINNLDKEIEILYSLF